MSCDSTSPQASVGGISSSSQSAKAASAYVRHEEDAVSRQDLMADAGLDLTLAQRLDGVEVEGECINEMFHLFFSHYSPLLPLLDPEVSANLYYSKLPLLFWAVIAVGSRRFSADPTLLEILTPSILNLAMCRVPTREAQPYAIQALLLLVTWPLPTDSIWNDVTFTLSGMIMNYALQIGLHYPAHSLDFAQTRPVVNVEAIQRRAQLWAHCVITCSAISCSSGYPPFTSWEIMTGLEGYLNSLPLDLQFRLKLQRLDNSVVVAMQKIGFTKGSSAKDEARSILVSVFEEQMADLEACALSELSHLYLSCSRLQLLSFHLYSEEGSLSNEVLLGLYNAACAIIRATESLGTGMQLSMYCTSYIYRMMVLSAFTILKLSKSCFATYLKADHVKFSYFSAIALAKATSIKYNDLPARSAHIMTQLWTSHKVFKEESLSKSALDLRVRTRLAMSLAIDCLWWWREEFGGQKSVGIFNPEIPDKQKTGSDSQSMISPSPGGTTLRSMDDPVLNMNNALGAGNDFMDFMEQTDPSWLLPQMDALRSLEKFGNLDPFSF